MATTTRPTQQQRYMQGVAVPPEAVRPEEFFARTRRHIRMEKAVSYDSSSGTLQDTIELLKADILGGVMIRFSGTLTTVKGAGTVATTRRFPYDLIKRVQVTANGASNLINVSGLKLKARDIMKKSDLTDRGVTAKVGATDVSQGTLAQALESWGVGSGETAIADGTYDVELEWFVPIAEDEVDLAGAIFLATSSVGMTMTMNYADPTELFTLTSDAAATLTGSFQILSKKFSIPVGADGGIVVPDLSMFHSLIESRVANGIQTGENELRIIGQGAGKSLLRLYWQTWNGAAPATPLAMNATNYGKQSWRYGNSENPDEFIDGSHLAFDMERRYNADLASMWGFGCHDFVEENSFRDVVDMGTTSELRLVTTIQDGVALVSPAVEYVTEVMFSAGQGA